MNDHCRTLTELRCAVRIPFDAKQYLHALNPRETGQGEEREQHLQQMFPLPYNPLTTITRPAVIVDVTSIVLVWYLPDRISIGLQVSGGVRYQVLVLIPMRQLKIWTSSGGLQDMLDKSRSGRANRNWRAHGSLFKTGDVAIRPGCINISPGWFMQGHEVRCCIYVESI